MIYNQVRIARSLAVKMTNQTLPERIRIAEDFIDYIEAQVRQDQYDRFTTSTGSKLDYKPGDAVIVKPIGTYGKRRAVLIVQMVQQEDGSWLYHDAVGSWGTFTEDEIEEKL